MKDRLERERIREARSSRYYTVEDVGRFLGENEWTKLVSCYSLQLGKIFLLLHLSVSEAKEKQKQGTVCFLDVIRMRGRALQHNFFSFHDPAC